MKPPRTVVHTLAGTALAAALLSPGTTATAAVAGTATVSASYACSVLGQSFDLPVDFTLTASGTGDRTTLTASGGRPTLPLDSAMTITQVTSTLNATVDGRATKLTGFVDSLTAAPNRPIDLPSLTTTVTASGPTLTFTPGAFSMALTAYGFPATIGCTTKTTPATVTIGRGATPPTVTPPVTPPTAGKPPVSSPTATPPRLSVKPGAKSVSRATLRGAKKRARVTVTLRKGARHDVSPRGRLVITVGKKKLRTVRTTKASTTVRVQLPRSLKKGRHRVSAVFTPNAAAKSAGVDSVRRSVWVRVKG